MEKFDAILDYLRQFNQISVLFRMLLACALGALLGLSRERNHQAAGLRTYYSVCLGAVATVLLGQYFNYMLQGPWAEVAALAGNRTDVSRFAAQVINGIGFLGAGTILVQQKRQIRGLTTAAGLWASACLGIAVGSGFYELVLCGFLMLLFSMTLLGGAVRKIESKRTDRRAYRIITARLSDVGEVMKYLKRQDLALNDYEMGMDPQPHLDVDISFGGTLLASDLVTELSYLDAVTSITAL